MPSPKRPTKPTSKAPATITTLTNDGQPNCRACPFADPKTGQPRHTPVLGTLPKGAAPTGVLVGEGPGNDEVDQGTPFVGRTGMWLDARLAEVGISRARLAVLNAMGCQPPQGLKTDSALREATKCCAPLFNRQHAAVKHLPTLAMGKWAGAAANGGKPISIETGRGFVRANLLVTWHPTYAAFHNPWKAGEFVNDLARFKRMMTGTLEAPPQVIINATAAQLNHLAATCGGVLACDVETGPGQDMPPSTGKDPTRCTLRTIAFGTTTHAVSFWWGSDLAAQKVARRILADPKIVKVFHNGHHFDRRVLKRYGAPVNNMMDTRDMRRAVSATSRLSLRFLTSVYSDFAPWKETEDDK